MLGIMLGLLVNEREFLASENLIKGEQQTHTHTHACIHSLTTMEGNIHAPPTLLGPSYLSLAFLVDSPIYPKTSYFMHLCLSDSELSLAPREGRREFSLNKSDTIES